MLVACVPLLLLLTTCAPVLTAPTTSHYNYLDLVLQWHSGVCYNKRCTDQTDPPSWTLHGLWPSISYTSCPQNCAGSRCSLDVTSLPVELVSEMEVKWPSFWRGYLDKWFWKHEYCKHGTCAADILPDAEDYFNKTLELLDRANMDGVLREAGVVPSENPYNVSEVQQAIHHTLGLQTARFWCRHYDGKQVLHEISLCVNKTFQFIDCPGGWHYRACDEDTPFYFV